MATIGWSSSAARSSRRPRRLPHRWADTGQNLRIEPFDAIEIEVGVLLGDDPSEDPSESPLL